jgi:hypothetical protein
VEEFTPLMMEVARTLLEEGADPNIR